MSHEVADWDVDPGSMLDLDPVSAERVEEFNSMIEQPEGALKTADDKVESDRLYDPEAEKVRIQRIRQEC